MILSLLSTIQRPAVLLPLILALCAALAAATAATAPAAARGSYGERDAPAEDDHYAELINKVIGWGLNNHAMLAINSTKYGSEADPDVIEIPSPVTDLWDPVDGKFRVVSVAAGDSHVMFLTCAGTVLSSGYYKYVGRNLSGADYTHDARPIEYRNGLGDLDLAHPEDLDEVKHTPLIIKIASQGKHSMGLSLHNQVYGWGAGSMGQLGLGDTSDRLYPTVLPLNTSELAQHTISDLCTGSEHSLLLTTDGKVFSFGSNDAGQLGLDSTEAFHASPRAIDFGTDELGRSRIISKLFCGPQNGFVITTNGELLSWGSNAGGVLALGNLAFAAKPTLAQFKPGTKTVKINCLSIGRCTTVFGDAQGNNYYSGRNFFDARDPTSLAIAPMPPVLPPGIESFKCSHDCCFAVYGSDIVSFCWQAGSGGISGQSGNRTVPLGDSIAHVDRSRVNGLQAVYMLAASSESKSLLAIEDPQLFCAGYHWKDNRTCNGRGHCVLTNTCMCTTGYGGMLCDEIQCFGQPINGSRTCGGKGRGTCTGPDSCECAWPYSGNACESLLACGKESALDAGVCSGHGRCVRGASRNAGKCDCSVMWEGSSCENMTSAAMWVLATVPLSAVCGLLVCIVSVVSIASSIRMKRMLRKKTESSFSLMGSQRSFANESGNSYGSTMSSGAAGTSPMAFGAISDLDGKSLEISISSNLVVPFEDIKMGPLIGSGAQAEVYAGTFNSAAVALKVYKKADFLSMQLTIDDFLREAELLASFGHHPNIVRLLGIVDMETKIALVQELCENGSLASFINRMNASAAAAASAAAQNDSDESVPSSRQLKFKSSHSPPGDDELATFGSPDVVVPQPQSPASASRGGVPAKKRVPFDVKLQVLLGIASAMEYLHSRRLIHRDLKCENILLDAGMRPRIADFGFSRLLNPGQVAGMTSNMTMNIGTASYIAPELICDEEDADQQGDSLGSGYNDSDVVPLQASLNSSQGSGCHGGYTSMIDVYSFGVLIYCVLFDTTRPYRRKSDLDIIIQVKNRQIRPKIDAQEMASLVDDFRASVESGSAKLSKSERDTAAKNMGKQLDACIALMQRCWDAKPSQRPTMRLAVAELKKIQGLR